MQKIIGALALGVGIIIATPASAHIGKVSNVDLTRQEARDRADQLFALFDANHDGIVTRSEAEQVGNELMIKHAATGADEAPGIGGHTLRFLEHVFAGMESVTRQQFEGAMLAHFDQMDRNHDGVLTAAERLQAGEQAAR